MLPIPTTLADVVQVSASPPAEQHGVLATGPARLARQSFQRAATACCNGCASVA